MILLASNITEADSRLEAHNKSSEAVYNALGVVLGIGFFMIAAGLFIKVFGG